MGDMDQLCGLVYLYMCVCYGIVHSRTGQHDDLSMDTIIRGRCHSRCFTEFASIQFRDQKTMTKDENTTLNECLMGCNETVYTDIDCSRRCMSSSETCLASCEFIRAVYKQTPTDNHGMKRLVFEEPEVVCKYLPRGLHNCTNASATLYLKWGPHSDSTSIDMTDSTPVYLIRSRRRHDNGVIDNWVEHSLVSSTFAGISELQCGATYQFQVFTFLHTGLYGESKLSEWSQAPTDSDALSGNMTIVGIQQSMVNQKPSITLTWDAGTDASCYYKIYWFGTTLPKQEELKVHRDLQYQIKGLDFSRNYSIKLFSYDEAFQSSTSDVTIHVMTPDCLEATGYNHTTCGPLQPTNFNLTILTPNYDDQSVRYVNVTVSWEPPLYTHEGRDVILYRLNFHKRPPSSEAHLLMPHSDKIDTIKSDARNYTIHNLHNHNYYRFELSAETDGGVGPRAVITDLLGLKSLDIEMGTVIMDQTKQTATEGLTPNQLVPIILIPASVFIVLLLVICYIYMVKRRANKTTYLSQRRSGPVEELNPIYGTCSAGGLLIDNEQKSKLETDGYEIDYSCLDFITVIGEGAFGKVVKAEYYPKQSDQRSKEGKIVAVKMLRDFYTGDESRNFALEIQAMKNLGHHPYIVSIIGCCLTGPKLCLVMDYCALGDLRNYLRKYRERLMCGAPYGMMTKAQSCYLHNQLYMADNKPSPSNSSIIDVDEVTEVSEAQLLSYARQITMGMKFLELRKFVHRDLAARNILLYDNKHIKISDFGLTRDVYETNVYQPTSARKLPYKWMAIESLFSQRFTIKSDVWSFGIVLWEIVTLGGSPYPSIPLKDLYGLLNSGYRMEKPTNSSSKVYQIMLSCWHPNPHNRPDFSQLRFKLEDLLEKTRSYIDLSVDVSEDFFNEATNESVITGLDSTGRVDGLTDCALSFSQDYLESKDLFVDIHDEPHECDDIKQACDESDMNKLLGSRDSDGTRYCELSKCTDTHRVRRQEKTIPNNRDLRPPDEDCNSCSMKRAKSLNSYWKDKTSIKDSLKDSLRNILDAVGTFTRPATPQLNSKFCKSTKKCVSLTDVSDYRTVQSTPV